MERVTQRAWRRTDAGWKRKPNGALTLVLEFAVLVLNQDVKLSTPASFSRPREMYHPYVSSDAQMSLF